MRECGACAGVTHPKLALILRYLAFTHTTMLQDDPSAPELSADDADTDQIISNLLGSDRDPAPLPAEGVPQVWHCLVCPFLVCGDSGFSLRHSQLAQKRQGEIRSPPCRWDRFWCSPSQSMLCQCGWIS